MAILEHLKSPDEMPMPPMRRPALLMLVCTSLLSGCATLDESTCRDGNWQQIGFADGLNGRTAARLGDHRKACERYGVAADVTGWNLGYSQGLARYCTAENGYIQGRDGRSYSDVCPPESDDVFRPAYTDGRRTYALLSQLKSLDGNLQQIQQTLDEDDERGRSYLDALRRGKDPGAAPTLLPPQERRQLQADYRRLTQDYNSVQQSLDRLDASLAPRYGAAPLQAVRVVD